MYSYHIVAELRQFRGVSAVAGRRIHRPVLKRDGMKVNYHRALGYCLSMIFSENRYALFRIMLELAGTDCRPSGLTGMDRFFLAIMVSAVLLLIVAADLLVNGPARQDHTAEMANMQPVVARLIR
ncbi:histidine kinase [Bradyrhizobium sp. B117]|uniref:histidine kinase n=1 Tax=Bradyrhizobium sp. B117 TaxID=3140246 RepID=UPI003183C142